METYLLNHCITVALDMIEARTDVTDGSWFVAWNRVANHSPSAQLTCYLLAITAHDAPPRPAMARYALAHELILAAAYPTGTGNRAFDRAHGLLNAAKSLQHNDTTAWCNAWYPSVYLDNGQTPETLTDMVLTAWRTVTGSRRAALRGIRRDLNSLRWHQSVRRLRNAVRYHLYGESQRRGIDGTYDYPAIPDFTAAQPAITGNRGDQHLC